MKRDAHIHSPYCPHGTKDTLAAYVEKALISGFTDISFTEHAPLPSSFEDTTPDKDSGMNFTTLSAYLEAVNKVKEVYKKDIKIRTGLEVDFIEGYENETRLFLDEIGPMLDDSILSVHFLKLDNKFICVDFSKDVFMDAARIAGSTSDLYDYYYDTVELSVSADLGQYKPRRIGHPTLIHKFQLDHGEKIDDTTRIEKLFRHIAVAGYEIDMNSAGFSKPGCQESYPPQAYLKYAESLGIPLIFGSDAHNVAGLHKHHEKLYNKSTN
ncbi:histidinol-phosphatase HisJ [Planomicrobium sp. Y74]|uniref:histidinol-phosphatase HisJ n=1 Tax=Planomicrobium sp. Y74 TaxID=2478977 RepID=UPI000EF53ACD|nr:histidinol-phosphatase HisJ [Planomicrobium sp. Y74]RLQ91864.1 histidinol-phosphatase HisJ [Planomicrobium sp. Y74]